MHVCIYTIYRHTHTRTHVKVIVCVVILQNHHFNADILLINRLNKLKPSVIILDKYRRVVGVGCAVKVSGSLPRARLSSGTNPQDDRKKGICLYTFR